MMQPAENFHNSSLRLGLCDSGELEFRPTTTADDSW